MHVPRRVLIAGCGDVGTRLGATLAAGGAEVFGLTRSSALPAPLRALHADLAAGPPMELPPAIDTLIFAAAPAARDEAAYRALYVDGLRHVLDGLRTPPRRALFVSSSAVWGERGGAWTDEDTPTAPDAFNGRVLLAAEALLAARCPGAVAVRLAGLYGPGRTWLLRRAAAGEPVQREPPVWSNRIHVEDAARALAHLVRLPDPAPVYLGVDDLPAPLHEVIDTLATWLGRPPPPAAPPGAAPTGKRLANRRLRATGFDFRWPDWRAGYRALLDAGS